MAALPSTPLARPGCLPGWRLRDNAACGAQRGAPLMTGALMDLWCAMQVPLTTGALMSARNDMEAAEPNVGQLHHCVELPRVDPFVSAEVRPLSYAGLRSTGEVA